MPAQERTQSSWAWLLIFLFLHRNEELRRQALLTPLQSIFLVSYTINARKGERPKDQKNTIQSQSTDTNALRHLPP